MESAFKGLISEQLNGEDYFVVYPVMTTNDHYPGW